MTHSGSFVTGVAEIVLNVRDINTMSQFYQEVMGFELHSEYCLTAEGEGTNGKPTIVFLTILDPRTPLSVGDHPQLLALIDAARHVHAVGKFENVAARRSTLNHLAFEISPDSFDDHEQRLERLGLKPQLSAFPDMQAKALFFRDPEENTLELICHAPK